MDLFPQLWEATRALLVAEDNSDEMAAYVAYFQKQWIDGRFCNWQRGAMLNGYSVTNNYIESLNRELKRTFFRSRVSLSELLTKGLALCENESLDYSQKAIKVKDHHCSVNEMGEIRRKAVALSKVRNVFIGEGQVWVVSHGRHDMEGMPDLQRLVMQMKRYIVNPGTRVNKGTCTCPCYRDKLHCKHVEALRLNLGIVRELPVLRRFQRPPRKRKRAMEYQSSSEEEEQSNGDGNK
jgi:hypothetical protein